MDYSKYFNQLEIEGYTVIPNVICNSQANEYINSIWNWLESLQTGIQREDPSTWKSKNWPISIHGIIQHYMAGQSKVVWDVRTNPKIINIFKELWDDKDLLTSFDGLCVMKPPNHGGSTRSKSWYHLDQGHNKVGKHCIQGLLNLEETTINDGSFMVLPGSHKCHQEFYKENNIKTKTDWYKFTTDDYSWYINKGFQPKRLEIPKGSVVLWDSRSVHCNVPPTKKSTNFRYVIYICMTPERLSTDKILDKRIKAFKELRMTSHWPHDPKLFPKYPQTYGSPKPEYKHQYIPVQLNDIGRKLVAGKKYQEI